MTIAFSLQVFRVIPGHTGIVLGTKNGGIVIFAFYGPY